VRQLSPLHQACPSNNLYLYEIISIEKSVNMIFHINQTLEVSHINGQNSESWMELILAFGS